MARIRTIKPEFWTHEDLSALPEATHMLAAALLNHADDEGYFNANPGLIKAACCPLREPSVSIQDSLNLLFAAGFISLCTGSDGKRYGRIVKFDEHQRVNRPTLSKIKPLCNVWEASPKAHAQLSEDSPPERNREQGKEQGREGEQGTSSLRSDSSTASPSDPQPLTLTGEPSAPADLAARRQERISTITDDAISAYNRILARPTGLLAAVHATVGRDKRRQQVQRSVKTASEICLDQFRDAKITPEFWETYFTACGEDGFHSGRGPYTGSHSNWRPDFEFLTRPTTMLKVFDRATAEDAA
jgi:hypothetical protein